MLSEYNKARGHHITVVFDGWKAGDRIEQANRTEGITVIYSRLGEKADSVIKRILKDQKREWIVISSDREITSYAWSHGGVPVPSERFRSIIQQPDREIGGDYDLLFDEEEQTDRKGKARTPSKKEKALLRILKKL